MKKKVLFEKMINFVTAYFEYGFAKPNMRQVSRVYFEAISIGSIKALQENPQLVCSREKVANWLSTGELNRIVAGKYKTHSKNKIRERVNYVKEHLLSE